MIRAIVTVMKPLTIAGIALVVVGVVALIYGGITYTSRETVVDIGPIHATADRERTFPLPPIAGIVAVAGGVALLVGASRKRA
jgi:drug/metabolite transporter (DMT)-like permease